MSRGGVGKSSITKSDVIDMLAVEQPQLAYRDVELAVKGLLERMSEAQAYGERIEVRGFGSFSLHHRPARVGRNPKTGETVTVPDKYVPHFKPGKEMRERVDQTSRDETSD
ncbi:MAG: Integration host factor subunit beta [Gammaproteobacteria bacterium]|nr:Integration host factor subunit beta [Gammaproteobacteria bacterium]